MRRGWLGVRGEVGQSFALLSLRILLLPILSVLHFPSDLILGTFASSSPSYSSGTSHSHKRSEPWSSSDLSWACNFRNARYGICDPDSELNQTQLIRLHQFLIDNKVQTHCNCRFFLIIAEAFELSDSERTEITTENSSRVEIDLSAKLFAQTLRNIWTEPGSCDSLVLFYSTSRSRFGVDFCFIQNSSSVGHDLLEAIELDVQRLFGASHFFQGLSAILQVFLNATVQRPKSRRNREEMDNLFSDNSSGIKTNSRPTKFPGSRLKHQPGHFSSSNLILAVTSALLLMILMLLIWFFCCGSKCSRAYNRNRRFLYSNGLIKTHNRVSMELGDVKADSPPPQDL